MVGQRPQIANGLYWVHGEIEQSLKRVRAELEQYLDAPEQRQRLDVAAEELRVVRGTVSMIQCFGAAALAEEMLELVRGLSDGRVPNSGEVLAALSGATLQLSDYVDLLVHGEEDRAIVLQPLINELRLSQGKPVLTEAALFAAQMHALGAPPAGNPAPNPGQSAQPVAQRELPAFQAAFLQWFRGQSTDLPMARIGKVADIIAAQAGNQALRGMWTCFGVLAEGMRGDQQFDSLDLKRLFGRAVTHLKALATDGEAAAAGQIGDTAELLLFHIVRAPRRTARAQELITQRRLDQLLPDGDQIQELRRRLRGPNTSILNRVHDEIRRDFAKIKDGIDLAVRTGGRVPVDLAATRERLGRLANTLGALGLPAPQQALQNQSRTLEGEPAGGLAWFDVATAILRVEYSLEEALFRALGRHGTNPARPYSEMATETPPAQDLRDSVKALMRESLVDFARLKAGVDQYLKSGDPTDLADAPRLLAEVASALLIIDRGPAGSLLRRLEAYARQGTLSRADLEAGEFERFADAVTCVELYLEALRDDLPDPGRILEDLKIYIDRLDFKAAEPAPAVEAVAAVPAVEPETAAAEVPASVGAAEPAPAVAAPPEAKSAAPASAPVGHGIDPEIREIFIEEAGEVLAELRQKVPVFKAEPRNRAALTDVRRAFHTLKGSGRMAGAMRIGEFGWAVESMLNRCLEGALAVRAPVLETVDRAVALLPGLIDDFRDDNGAGTAENPAVSSLIAHVSSLAANAGRGETDMLAVFREDARERLSFIRRWLEEQSPSKDAFDVEPEVIRAFHTLRGSAAVVDAEGVRGLATAFENFLNGQRLSGRALTPPALSAIADAVLALLSWVESVNVFDAGVDDLESWNIRLGALQTAAVETVPVPSRPPVDEPYTMAALDALQALEQSIRNWGTPNGPAGAAAELGSHFAELAESSRRGGCGALARTALAVSDQLLDWRESARPSAEFVGALLDVMEGMYQQLEVYREGGPEQSTEALIAAIRNLPAPPAVEPPAATPESIEPAASADEVMDQTAPAFAPEPAPAAAATSAAEDDAELQEIFLAEAIELLDAMEQHLQAWRVHPQSFEPADELRRNLHTLKGSARTTGIEAIGTVAHRLESLLKGESAEMRQPAISLVEVGVGELRHLIGNLSAGLPLLTEPALAAIEAAIAAGTPAATTAEPALQFAIDSEPALAAEIHAELPAGQPAEEAPAPAFAEPEAVDLPIVLESLPEREVPDSLLELLLEPIPESPVEPMIEPAAVGSAAETEVPAAEPPAAIAPADQPPIGGLQEAVPAVEPAEPQAFEFELDAAEPATETAPATAEISLDLAPELIMEVEAASAPPAVDAPVELGAPAAAGEPAVLEITLDLAPSTAAPEIGTAATAMEPEPVVETATPIEQPAAPEAQPEPDLAIDLGTLPEEQSVAPPAEPEAEAALPSAAAELVAEPQPPPVAEAPAVHTALQPFPPAPDSELIEVFSAEAEELLEMMEHDLEVWRRQPDYADAPMEMRRGLHTLKGSARASGAEAIGTVAHQMETLLANGAYAGAAALAMPLGVGLDEIRQLLHEFASGRPPDPSGALAAIAAAVPPSLAFALADTAEHLSQPEAAAEAPALQSDEPLPPPALESPVFQPPYPEPAAPMAPELQAVAAETFSPEPAAAEWIAAPIEEPAPPPPGFAEPEPLPEPAPAADMELAPPAPEAFAPGAELAADLPSPAEFVAPEPEATVEIAPAIAEAPLSEPAVPVQPVSAAPAPVDQVPEYQPAYQPPAQSFASAIPEVDPELADIFAAEAAELLEQLDLAFEAWQNGDAEGAPRDVQRALHTLKGGARMASLDLMGDVTHNLETHVNSVLATGEFPDTAVFTSMRAALERLQGMHDQIRRGEAAQLVGKPEVEEAFAVSIQAEPLPVPAAAPTSMPAAPQVPAQRPAVAATAAQWAPELFWKPEEDLTGFALARRETARVPVDSLDGMLNQAGEISIYRSRLDERNSSLRMQLSEMAQTIGRIREQLRMFDIETEAQIAARGRTLGAVGADRYAQDFDPLEMDRYSRMQELSRALAESISDVASLRATMDEAVSESDTLLLQQSRIATEVQQGLMGALMVPFSRQVQRLTRVIRQTAQENNKLAEAHFEGAEVELDRNVLERITGPLEHLLRNSVVHGIEDPAERALAGKPAVGAINVRLSREGSQLLVEVADDGAGLNFAAIRAKAIQRGMMAADAQLSDDDLARFIFEPGFSTAKRLTQDAGRGIGMDVASSEVKQLGGTLELRSEAHKGTRFLLRLPLTLAVSHALLVGAGSESFAIPLPSVEGIARVPRSEIERYLRTDGPQFAYGGHNYSMRHLGDYVGVPYALDARVRSVTTILVRLGEGITAATERRVGLVIDTLYGNREIVSKPIGPQISSVPGVAGATILADGRVVTILDVPALVAERARRALLADLAARASAEDTRETVMVVDDSITMRRVAERLLTRNGYRVITAKDGLDAIAVLQTESPAAVLLDIEMPRADGFEVAAFIRNNVRLKEVPIIMITSRSGDKHRERARSLGVDRYLIKPYQEDRLLAEVKTMLEQGRA
jgi:chemosensory pili system protein ChpA (sensor histidine kinase/response regulator)